MGEDSGAWGGVEEPGRSERWGGGGSGYPRGGWRVAHGAAAAPGSTCAGHRAAAAPRGPAAPPAPAGPASRRRLQLEGVGGGGGWCQHQPYGRPTHVPPQQRGGRDGEAVGSLGPLSPLTLRWGGRTPPADSGPDQAQQRGSESQRHGGLGGRGETRQVVQGPSTAPLPGTPPTTPQEVPKTLKYPQGPPKDPPFCPRLPS